MYHLFLTAKDVQTIDWIAGRYCWSEILYKRCSEGDNEIPEYIAWELNEAFEEDTKGGHPYFPCLDHRSDLASKLFAFMEQIV